MGLPTCVFASLLPRFSACSFAGDRGRTCGEPVVALQADAQHTTVAFTLRRCAAHSSRNISVEARQAAFDPATNKISGEMVVDAKSGESGNGMRDRKMHREVLESDRNPEIVFRPDRVDGSVGLQGKSPVRVHGIFAMHGTEHELTVPAEVEMSSDHWSAVLHLNFRMRSGA